MIKESFLREHVLYFENNERDINDFNKIVDIVNDLYESISYLPETNSIVPDFIFKPRSIRHEYS